MIDVEYVNDFAPLVQPMVARPRIAGRILGPDELSIANKDIAYYNYNKMNCNHMDKDAKLAFEQDNKDTSVYRCKCCGIKISSDDMQRISDAKFDYWTIYSHREQYISTIKDICGSTGLKTADLANICTSAIQYGYGFSGTCDCNDNISKEISKIFKGMRSEMLVPGINISYDNISQLDTLISQFRKHGGDIIVKGTPTLCYY